MPLRACLLLLFTLCAASCNDSAPPTMMTVTVAGKPFQCRIANDDDSRAQGLGGVERLAANEGMIFVYPGSNALSFWMRRCVMDLDIAFIDPLGFVTAVHTMAKEDLQREGESEDVYLDRLKSYPSIAPAQFALEVAPGTFAPLGVTRGSRIEFDRNALKMLAH